MEMFFLRYVNETMYLLWNLPFFKSVLPKAFFFSFLNTWADNGSTNQYSVNCSMARVRRESEIFSLEAKNGIHE